MRSVARRNDRMDYEFHQAPRASAPKASDDEPPIVKLAVAIGLLVPGTGHLLLGAVGPACPILTVAAALAISLVAGAFGVPVFLICWMALASYSSFSVGRIAQTSPVDPERGTWP